MKKIIILLIVMIATAITGSAAYASCDVVTVMYHDVTDNSLAWSDYCIPASQLAEDIEYFTSRGYITLTASELASESMDNLEGKKILLLTFDDGYAGWYTDVFPVLKQYNAKATMFVVGSFINKYGYLNKYQINEMAHSGLVEIGSHTHNIHNMPLERVRSLYNDGAVFWDVISDIKNSGAAIKSVTGYDVTSISWPYGYYTAALDEAVKSSLGYKISFSTNYGVNRYYGYESQPFNRINREYNTTPESLYSRAEGKF